MMHLIFFITILCREDSNLVIEGRVIAAEALGSEGVFIFSSDDTILKSEIDYKIQLIINKSRTLIYTTFDYNRLYNKLPDS